MAAEVPSEWTVFFTQLSSFVESCDRQYGLANEHFTEYAIEHFSICSQSLQALISVIEPLPDLRSIYIDLNQLLQSIQGSLLRWRSYYDSLDFQRIVHHYVPPQEVSRQRGRPRFEISKEQLEHLRSLSFSWTAIADVLLVSRMTIYRRRAEYGILDEAHSAIHDRELIEFVRHTLVQHPRVGQTFIIGRLRAQGYRVTRERVRQAIRTCDPLNVVLRWQGMAIRRRPYSVPGPNVIGSAKRCMSQNFHLFFYFTI